jgi:hypothetical protein
MVKHRLLTSLVFNAAAALWVWHDARRRRARKPTFAAALTLMWGPLGLAFYVADRPLVAGETRPWGTAWTMSAVLAAGIVALIPAMFVLVLQSMEQKVRVAGSLAAAIGPVPAAFTITIGACLSAVAVALGAGYWMRQPSTLHLPPAQRRGVPLTWALVAGGSLACAYAVLG